MLNPLCMGHLYAPNFGGDILDSQHLTLTFNSLFNLLIYCFFPSVQAGHHTIKKEKEFLKENKKSLKETQLF